MRALLPAGQALGYWKGPDTEQPEAAFLAVQEPEKGLRSAVSLGDKTVFRFVDTVRLEGATGKPVTSLDLEGFAVDAWVVLFYTEQRLARSTLSFDTGEGLDNMRFLLTGLAPGSWEIWRNGWVVDIGVPVNREEAVLYFEGRAGSYFIRRL